jgi:hypothetical protein
VSLAIPGISVWCKEEVSPENQLSQLTSLELEKTYRIIADTDLFPCDLAKIISSYILDPNLTDWYSSLNRFKVLPKKIPRLPANIIDILNNRCPVYYDKRKADGSFYKITDTHILILTSIQEFKTLNLFEKYMCQYNQKHKLNDAQSFQIERFWQRARSKYGDRNLGTIHWELITSNIIPGSQGLPAKKQMEYIQSFSRKFYIDYTPLSLESTFALFLHKLATEQKPNHSFTVIQESIAKHHLVVGLGEKGLIINFIKNDQCGIGCIIRRQLLRT